METKKINDRFSFVNSYGRTGDGFYHKSGLSDNGNVIQTAKCNYQNRTWEAYPYQTVNKKCVRLVIAKTKDENELIALNELLTKLGD
jgi:hypothetical protein